MTMSHEQEFLKNMQYMKQSSGMDIFSTMEQEMKQIMELFSKERRARKKEIQRLRLKIKERDQKIATERENHKIERSEIIHNWKNEQKQ